jgi:hypothetical protein
MFSGAGGEDSDGNQRMADLQVRSSFIQFCVVVGLINLSKD